MRPIAKVALVAVGVLALSAVAALLLIDRIADKPRMEAAASNALGMEVTIEGRVRVGLLSGLHFAIESVRIRNRGAEVATVEEADVEVALLSLLRKEPRYGDIVLKRARISIERGRDAKYNFDRASGNDASSGERDIPRVAFSDLLVVYVDKASARRFEARRCNGELTRMRHPGGDGFLARLSVKGQFACAELAAKDAAVSDLEFSLEATDGVFDFKPITMGALGGRGSGSMRVDRSGKVPVVRVDYALKKFRAEEYFRQLPKGVSARGPMDFSIAVAMRGNTHADMRRSAAGEMSLSGANLTLSGVDLDKDFARYQASQSFNLFDVTAFVFAGPVGLAVTKGGELAGLLKSEGGSTEIRTVVSHWRIDKGVAHARDVALTTRENRLALQGGLDFVNKEFDDVVVAVVDANGCAKARQRITGPFAKPAVEPPSVVRSITGPIAKLLDKAKKLIPGAAEKCEVFYSGSVAPPAQ